MPQHTDTPTISIPATGNASKPGRHEMHLKVSGPHDAGNFSGGPEVHLQMIGQDGEFAQGWFPVPALLAAIAATEGS
jgi:hypothetical protein